MHVPNYFDVLGIAAFGQALNTSLAALGVNTTQIQALSIVPGPDSIDVQLTGSNNAVNIMRLLALQYLISVPYDGYTYYLVGHTTATAAPESHSSGS